MIPLIEQAICEKHLLEFEYDGRLRLAAPHVLGVKGSRIEVLTLQVGGQSSFGGPLPEWRRFFVDRMKRVRLRDEKFDEAEMAGVFDSKEWDFVVASVAA